MKKNMKWMITALLIIITMMVLLVIGNEKIKEKFNAEIENQRLGNFETEIVEDFFQAVAFSAEMNLHANVIYGRNTHHKIEALFKAWARAMRQAVEINPEIKGVNSTKGVI